MLVQKSELLTLLAVCAHDLVQVVLNGPHHSELVEIVPMTVTIGESAFGTEAVAAVLLQAERTTFVKSEI